MVNEQYGNAGNLGDILKHGALVELAVMMSAPGTGPVSYVETNTFILRAPIANNNWQEEVAVELNSWPGYQRYYEREVREVGEFGHAITRYKLRVTVYLLKSSNSSEPVAAEKDRVELLSTIWPPETEIFNPTLKKDQHGVFFKKPRGVALSALARKALELVDDSII